MEKNKSIPNYITIFEKRIADQVRRIKDELSKPKKHRNKKMLRDLLHDIKKVKKAISTAKEDHAAKCPHCHKRI